MEYIGTFEVMKLLNIKTKVTIYRWVSLGKFLAPYTGKSGNFLWNKKDVEAWKQEQVQKGFIL